MKMQFFKPTVGKVILALVLTFLLSMWFHASAACPEIVLLCQDPETTIQVYTSFWPGSCPACQTKVEIAYNTIIPIMIYVIISYIVSCLIMYLFKRK